MTTPKGREDLQPFLLISTVPSRCMSETADWNVDSETGSVESMGSDLDSVSGLNTGRGDPLCSSEMFGIGRDRESRGTKHPSVK